MATANDIKSFNNVRAAAGNALPIVPPIPTLPDEVKKRFPTMVDWERKMHEWRQKVNVVLGFKE